MTWIREGSCGSLRSAATPENRSGRGPASASPGASCPHEGSAKPCGDGYFHSWRQSPARPRVRPTAMFFVRRAILRGLPPATVSAVSTSRAIRNSWLVSDRLRAMTEVSASAPAALSGWRRRAAALTGAAAASTGCAAGRGRGARRETKRVQLATAGGPGPATADLDRPHLACAIPAGHRTAPFARAGRRGMVKRRHGRAGDGDRAQRRRGRSSASGRHEYDGGCDDQREHDQRDLPPRSHRLDYTAATPPAAAGGCAHLRPLGVMQPACAGTDLVRLSARGCALDGRVALNSERREAQGAAQDAAAADQPGGVRATVCAVRFEWREPCGTQTTSRRARSISPRLM